MFANRSGRELLKLSALLPLDHTRSKCSAQLRCLLYDSCDFISSQGYEFSILDNRYYNLLLVFQWNALKILNVKFQFGIAGKCIQNSFCSCFVNNYKFALWFFFDTSRSIAANNLQCLHYRTTASLGH